LSRVKSKVTKQPEPQIRTSQFISSRLRLFDGEQELQLTNAHFERFEQENGILFAITLESSEEVFLFVQLAVVGDQELDAVQKSENNIQPRVLDTHESRCENCKVGRACDKARYSSIGVTESNEVLLYLIITEPTPLDATGNPQAFRLLLTLVNSTEPTVISEAIIIKEDLVAGKILLLTRTTKSLSFLCSFLNSTPLRTTTIERRGDTVLP
jgi:hypothetical protein